MIKKQLVNILYIMELVKVGVDTPIKKANETGGGGTGGTTPVVVQPVNGGTGGNNSSKWRN